MTYIPQEDGITHINVYSKGRTALGLFLSNFAEFVIDTGEDGIFNSVEGYWYWLSVDPKLGDKRERLRKVYGWEAKKLGRELHGEDPDDWDTEFQNKIKKAIKYKILNSSFVEQFKKSDLPFVHYYVFGNKIHLGSGEWIMGYLGQLRTELQENVEK